MKQNLLVLTKDYEWLVPSFLYLFEKYWGQEPLLISSDKPLSVSLPEWCEWLQVPAYAEGIWSWQFWFGNGLRSILAEIDEPVVALFLPDYWICKPVDSTAVNTLTEYILRCGNIIRVNLQDDTCLKTYGKFRESYKGLEIIAATPGCIHCGLEAGTAMGVDLWDRHKLFDLLEPHWSPWALETIGSQKMWRVYPDWVSVGTRPSLVWRANVLSKFHPRLIDLRKLPEEDYEEVKSWLPSGYQVLRG